MNQVHYMCMYCDLYDYTDSDTDKWRKQKYNSDNGEELAKAFLLQLRTVETQVMCLPFFWAAFAEELDR